MHLLSVKYLDALMAGFLFIIFPAIFPPNDTREAVSGPASDCLGSLSGKASAAFDNREGPRDGLDII
jgi:hypothetical protein